MLVALGAGIVYSELADYGGATVGSISAGFPPISAVLPWSHLPSLLVPGIVIATSRVRRGLVHRPHLRSGRAPPWNANREFVGQGVANLAAGFSAASPSAPRSRAAPSTASREHGRRAAAVVTGLAVLAFLPAASVLSPLPQAVLAAIVIVAVAGLVRPLPLLELAHCSRPQFAIAAVTFVADARARSARRAGRSRRRGPLDRDPPVARAPLDIESGRRTAMLHLKPNGVLWFGIRPGARGPFLALLADNAEARRLVVHFDGLGRIDLSGALALRTLLADARGAGLDVSVEGSPAHAARILRRALDDEA